MFFLGLKFLLLVSGMFVVGVSSPVHSVFLLILTFFCAAALLLFIGVDFLAFVFIIVYIGAIAVLFLFIVMMLNLRSHFEDNVSRFFISDPKKLLRTCVLVFITAELTISFAVSDDLSVFYETVDIVDCIDTSDTMLSLGVYLYVLSFIVVFLVGYILLISMIGAILFTLRHAQGVRRQNVFEQTGRVGFSAIRRV